MSEKDEIREELKQITEQREAIQLAYNEIERTIEEIEKAQGDIYIKREDPYSSLIGMESVGVFYKKDKNEILSELKDRKELLEVNIKSLDRKIQELRSKLQE